MPGPARDTFLQVRHYITRTINFGTANAATGVEIPFSLPDGALHMSTHVNVATAFNAGSTNVLQVGTQATPEAYMTATTAAAGTAGMKTATGTGRIVGDTTVIVRFSQTGTAATAGEADIVLEYLPRRS